ncbi:MAG: long-chain fatty acid--CoA ligase [Candidatus Aminicenantes bacterium]|nr:long-chain fatty acid--CoA ligase [Candidatus Aminicenantes bacterium]
MIETIPQLFLNTVKSYLKNNLLLYKEQGRYVPISTKEFSDYVQNLSLGLRDLGIKKGNKLILLSENCPNWVITDLANLCLGGITVPIYPSLTPDQIKYIIEDSDAEVVMCSSPELWQKIQLIKHDLTKVKHYIVFFKDSPEEVFTLEQIMERGEKVSKENPGLFEGMALKVEPEDVASILYTSGTTGLPKGVILTHKNFISNIEATLSVFDITYKDTALSFLPLSHVLERMVVFCYLYTGASIAFAESLDTLAENLLEIRPNIMVSVPRVFEKIYSKVIDNVLSSSPLKRKIFYWAVNVAKKCAERKLKKQPVPRSLKLKVGIANKLVFSKVLEKTGGRVRFFVSGGAPLAKDIAEFFYSIGLLILEGYGLTETSPVVSANTFDNMRFGSVGKTISGVEVKIAQDGEILVKGPNVMKGYYKKEEETREAFEGGWFHTGDIGHIDEDGFLVITDRKKDLIVTSGGKNVAPQPIENILKTSPYISNAVVIGDRRRFMSALIVPDFEKLEEYARFNNIPFNSHTDLVKNDEIIRFIESEVDCRTPSLSSYEKIKKIALLDREFEIEKEEITPTLKVKRNIVEEKYKDLIDAFYKEE